VRKNVGMPLAMKTTTMKSAALKRFKEFKK
jgi:hypothetical protein